MIKNLVFDMGGVIIDYNPQKTLNTYFPEKYHDVLNQYVFKNNIWSKLDNGLMTSDDAIEDILPRIPKETRPLIKEMINDFYPYMKPFPEMYELIKAAKAAGYPVYLLSNATPRFFDHFLDIPALTLMDGYFISALYKIIKPHREIYEAFCNKFSLEPCECFFIDDMEANIKGAEDFGMSGFVYTNPDTESLKKALLQKGVKI